MKRVMAMLTALGVALASCGGTQPTPGTNYDIKGNISDVRVANSNQQARGVLGTVRIEGEKIEGNKYDKAVVTVTKSTRIWEKKGNGVITASFADLQFGALVTCKLTEPVLESYPVQAGATEIVILLRMPQQ